MFILDTDTCIYALKQDENVLQQLLSTPREDVLVSVITEAELRTGAAKSTSPVAVVRAKLERAGKPVGPAVTLAGCLAVGRDPTRRTHDARARCRVTGLAIAKWTRRGRSPAARTPIRAGAAGVWSCRVCGLAAPRWWGSRSRRFRVAR